MSESVSDEGTAALEAGLLLYTPALENAGPVPCVLMEVIAVDVS